VRRLAALVLASILFSFTPSLADKKDSFERDRSRLPEARLPAATTAGPDLPSEPLSDDSLPRAQIVKEQTSVTLRTQQETNRVYGYVFDKGMAARIESARVRPKAARPGEEIEAILTYVVLTHSRDRVQVLEVREVWVGGGLIGRSEAEVVRGGGTYQSKVSFLLPGGLKEGSCKVVYLVRTPHSRDLREARFTLDGAGSAGP
jgi:hypothetical protein